MKSSSPPTFVGIPLSIEDGEGERIPQRGQGVRSLYLHLPFCKRKCNYCDFVSYVGKEELIDEYVEAICQEINSPPCSGKSSPPPSLFKRGGKEGGEFSTIFFGGGTPTLLEPKHFEKILENVAATFRSPFDHGGLKTAATSEEPSLEISIEANPGTADKTKLKKLRQLGINRLSIGVQSFNDKHLKTLGRIHDANTAKRFYHDACAAGFDNINLDLIYGLPDQTLAEWKTDLHAAIALQPNHLSAYGLQIEPGTPFASLPVTRYSLPDDETELAMYEHTIETLTSTGFKHYEISNFAQPGYECRHNLTYWQNKNYLGVGAGAHSQVNGRRWSNSNCIESYIQNASRKTPNETRFARPERNRGAPDQSETLFLGLRLLDGLPTSKFKGFEKEVAELIKDGLLTERNSRYRLTRQGLYLGNLVFEKFV